ncbi:MAG: OmpA family protein, partial [Bacteroidia bacterium]
MRKLFFIFFSLFFLSVNAQDNGLLVKAGDKAPGFILNQQNSLQSFSMPYYNRLILIHFWSTSVPRSKVKNRSLNRLAGRYKNAIYKNADGFDLIAVCVQSDKKAWNEDVNNDSLNNFVNGIAQKGFNDDICKKYGVTSLPADVLIDEKGIIIGINPKITAIEDMLDEKKNFLPIKKDVVGTIGHSSNRDDILKFGKLYLFDSYNDSVSSTVTNANGRFSFYDIKLNQDFILKIDNQMDIVTTDPLSIYNKNGEHILDAVTRGNGFVFYIPSNMSYKLTDDNADEVLNGSIGKVNVTKNLVFQNNGASLILKDEQELQSILTILQKNKDLNVIISTHSDSKPDEQAAMALTTKQAKTVKDFFIKKGIAA